MASRRSSPGPSPDHVAASPRAIYAHLRLDGVSDGIAVGVLAHEARVDDVRGFRGESRDAARRADRCSPDVGVIALAHAPSSSQEKRVSIDLPGSRESAPHRRLGDDHELRDTERFVAERISELAGDLFMIGG